MQCHVAGRGTGRIDANIARKSRRRNKSLNSGWVRYRSWFLYSWLFRKTDEKGWILKNISIDAKSQMTMALKNSLVDVTATNCSCKQQIVKRLTFDYITI
jgi:hypothetical protein